MSAEPIAPEPHLDSSDTLKSPTEPPPENLDTNSKENGNGTGNHTTGTTEGRKQRPRLDLTGALGGKERKRGKSMFGILLGTLNKAKIEDKERNASDAAKKRQLIEQRLQAKLRKETDSVRRAEDAKKDKTLANRKEEDLQIKDSIYKLRRTRLPLLANFLLTSDVIPPSLPSSLPPLSPSGNSPPPTSTELTPTASNAQDLAKILSGPPRAHPPPLYYLPAVLTPAQEAFLSRRKAEVSTAAEKEWSLFQSERAAGIEEIRQLRQRVAEEEARRRSEKEEVKDEAGGKEGQDEEMGAEPPLSATATENGGGGGPAQREDKDVDMDVDDAPAGTAKDSESNKDKDGEKKDKEKNGDRDRDRDSAMQGDDEDAVEY